MGKLLVVHIAENHENRSLRGSIPLLTVDMWEHAYYLKYRNNRAAFVAAWWNLANFREVARRFQEVK